MNDISPMFAVEADKLLLSGFPDEAAELCLIGLEAFPDYPTAYTVLAKAYHLTGNENKCAELITAALEKFPTSKTVQRVRHDFLNSNNIFEQPTSETETTVTEEEDIDLDDMFDFSVSETEFIEFELDPEIEKEAETAVEKQPNKTIRNLFSKNSNPNISEDSPQPENDKKEYHSKTAEFPSFQDYAGALFADNESEEKDEPDLFDYSNLNPTDDLNILARKLDSANIPNQTGEEEPDSDEPPATMLNDTIVGIYEQQGLFEEAIKAYKTLSEKSPDKFDFYADKIKVLKKKIKQR